MIRKVELKTPISLYAWRIINRVPKTLIPQFPKENVLWTVSGNLKGYQGYGLGARVFKRDWGRKNDMKMGMDTYPNFSRYFATSIEHISNYQSQEIKKVMKQYILQKYIAHEVLEFVRKKCEFLQHTAIIFQLYNGINYIDSQQQSVNVSTATSVLTRNGRIKIIHYNFQLTSMVEMGLQIDLPTW